MEPREPVSYRKRKLIAQKEPCSERNACYQKRRKEQRKKQKRREKKTEGKPDEENVKNKVKVTDFRPRQIRMKELGPIRFCPAGKLWSLPL